MIITQTPLRISFLGGNTDFPSYFKKYGGAVLATAIDKYVYCIVKERFDDEIRINYSIKEVVTKVENIKHDLVREAMKLVGVEKGIEITFLSDIPSEGSGLGSSSSVTVGVLNALHHYIGQNVGARELTEEACRIEIDILKKPIGIQDQHIAAFGGLNLIEFNKKIAVHPLDLSDSIRADLQNCLMLFYTGRTRKASRVLSKMKLNKKILDRNKRLAYEGKKALENGDVFILGDLLDEYWNLKKRLNKGVSDRFIDEMYEGAMIAGARGGKIVGAGGGGFLLLVVPGTRRYAVRHQLGLRELPFGLSNDGSKVIFDIRR